MADVEMTIDSIRMSEQNYQRVVILKEKTSNRYLPIWIGPAEADVIALKLNRAIKMARPATHDFLYKIIKVTGFKVKLVKISALLNDTFYAKVFIANADKSYEVDCRPSDALAVAVRARVPVYVAQRVLNKAGIILDPETGKPIAGSESSKASEEDKIFRRFPRLTLQIFALAEEEAKRMNHSYTGTEHLLLALVRKAPNAATDILTNLGVSLAGIPRAVESAIAYRRPAGAGESGLSTGIKTVLKLSLDEANRAGSRWILPQHLLFAMVEGKDTTAAKALKDLKVDVQRIQAELDQMQSKREP